MTILHQEMRPRIKGAIPPVLFTPSCRAHGKFTSTFNLLFSILPLHFFLHFKTLSFLILIFNSSSSLPIVLSLSLDF